MIRNQLPGGDFYQAALLNFRMIASAVLTTEEAIAKVKGRTQSASG